MSNVFSIFAFYNSEIKFGNLKHIERNHTFIIDEVFNKIEFFESISNPNICYYSFFEEITFVVIRDHKKISGYNLQKDNLFRELKDIHFILSEIFVFHQPSESILSNEETSKLLRGTSTMKIDNLNCYDNKDIKLVVYENGFLLQEKFDLNDRGEKMNRSILLYLLSLAYKLKNKKYLECATIAYSSEKQIDLIKVRRDICSFDLKYYFTNPIKQQNYQMSDIWSLFFCYHKIDCEHKEIKSQVSDIASIIEAEYREKLGLQQKKRDTKLNAIVFIISIASIISIVNDLFELVKKF